MEIVIVVRAVAQSGPQGAASGVILMIVVLSVDTESPIVVTRVADVVPFGLNT